MLDMETMSRLNIFDIVKHISVAMACIKRNLHEHTHEVLLNILYLKKNSKKICRI